MRPARRTSRYRSRSATRGRVVGDVPVQPRDRAQHLLDGEVDHGRRDRRAALGDQRRRTEQLAQAVQRQDVDGDGPAASPQRPPGHHAGRVGRDDHGHRRQRIAALRRPHRRRQTVESAGPVDDGGGGDRHATDSTDPL